MPNIKSAKKRVAVSQKQALENTIIKSVMKTNIKKFQVAEGEDAQASFKTAVKSVDKAVAKGVIHKNAANRKKSQLAKQLSAK
ncbi:MAG: 30S ribosomal protein S20 [Christensenellales bacterium]